MKRILLGLGLIILASSSLTACVRKPYTCTDPMGCIAVGNAANIKIATLLTMSGPDSVYGIDAVRGVELAIADKRQVFGHGIDLVKADDLCTEAGGQKGATDLAADPQIAGIIGTTCSSAAISAAGDSHGRAHDAHISIQHGPLAHRSGCAPGRLPALHLQ